MIDWGIGRWGIRRLGMGGLGDGEIRGWGDKEIEVFNPLIP